MARLRLLIAAVVALLFGLGPVGSAHADEVAPELETSDLRLRAQGELKRLVARLDPVDRKRLVGIYVAFDPDPNDPIAQVGCDDDGDYVVLVSDALLRLASSVARGATYLDVDVTSQKIEDYAAFLAQSQVTGRRLLPPPAGFFSAQVSPTHEERLAEALSFVVGRELAHLRAGDLVCPKPTPTKEIGDDEWSAGERRRANDLAARVYGQHAAERDAEAIGHVLKSGLSEKGALAWLRFFARFEAERGPRGRFLPTYAALHPNGATRMRVVQAAIDREKHAEQERSL